MPAWTLNLGVTRPARSQSKLKTKTINSMELINHYQTSNTARWINARSTAFALLLMSAATIPVRADVITDWNDIALPLLRAAPKLSQNHQFAIMHVAQFEAVNAVVGKYTPYVVNLA